MVRAPIIPLLLAGGAGTRLWPVSGDAMPKQFLPLVGERSTFQQALTRVSAADLFGPPIIVTANDFRFFARAQANELPVDATIVLEPMRRDSAPAIAAGAALARRRVLTRSCWRWPPTMSSATSMRFTPPVLRGGTRRTRGGS